MRTIVDLPSEDIVTLDGLRDARGASRAALIREAVSEFIQKNKKATHEEVDGKVFGLWKEKGVDGLTYQEELRSEW